MKSNIKKIYYWSPSLVDIATNKAVINSAYSLKKFNYMFDCSIINFFGEFKRFSEDIKKKKINLINHYNETFYNFFPKYGKLKSRFSFVVIFILSFFPLKNLLNRQKPDFLIIHLITSLPLFLLVMFNFKTKFILRVSGLPRLTFLRKLLWKIASKKIYAITCPTKSTMKKIIDLKIFEKEKIYLLYDPIIEVKKFSKKKFILHKESTSKDNYFLAAGRLTKQKNLLFLCEAFKIISKKKNNIKLVIAGEGEERQKLQSFINKNNLGKNINLIGHVNNIFEYMYNADAFILSSLWEDPGFVLMEAAFARTLVISSDCYTGPRELIIDNVNGILFESNNLSNIVEKINFYFQINESKKNEMKLNNFKLSRSFTIFNHYLKLFQILTN